MKSEVTGPKPKKKNNWALVTFIILFSFLLLCLLLPVRVDIGIYVPFQTLIEGYEHPVTLFNLLAVSALFFPTYVTNALSRKIVLSVLSFPYLIFLFLTFKLIEFNLSDYAVSELGVGVYLNTIFSLLIMILSFLHAWRKSDKVVKVKHKDLLDDF